MNVLARRDRLGAERVLFDPETGVHASDLHAFLARVPEARSGGLDPMGIAAAWSLAEAPDRTCLAKVRAVPPGHTLQRAKETGITVVPARARSCALPPPLSRLGALLADACARSLSEARRPVVALGGGVDAPLAVLAARRAGVTLEHAIHVSLPGTTYDESLAARETARALGLALHEVRITVDELAAELPRAVRLAETPLYNLHPVSRVVAARIARERGHDALVTGDGADQAARGAVEAADYLPIVRAITVGMGLTLASPFLDDGVVALLVAARDPDKRALRELACTWSLSADLARRPKAPCFAPPLPRAAFPGPERLAALSGVSQALARPLAWSGDDRSNVGIASLAAFVSAFELEVG